MNKLLLATAIATMGFAASASAGTLTIGNLSITQVAPRFPGTFDDDPVGAATGYSEALTSAGVTPIVFATDGAVENTTTGQHAIPAGDTTNYLYGINGANGLTSTATWGGQAIAKGATVLFVSAKNSRAAAVYVNSFYIYWGSIDSNGPGGDGFSNILSLSNGDVVTGANLAAAGALFNPVVNGDGNQFNANDNQWFLISDTTPFYGFNAQNMANPAFEFDMATPEPSTWAMMGVGFAALAYAGFRRSTRRAAIV